MTPKELNVWRLQKSAQDAAWFARHAFPHEVATLQRAAAERSALARTALFDLLDSRA